MIASRNVDLKVGMTPSLSLQPDPCFFLAQVRKTDNRFNILFKNLRYFTIHEMLPTVSNYVQFQQKVYIKRKKWVNARIAISG